MEPAHRMMVGSCTAMLDSRRRTGRQHRHELVEHDPLVEDAAKCEVEARPVGIDMRETAGDRTLAARHLPDGIVCDLRDLRVEIAEPAPL